MAKNLTSSFLDELFKLCFSKKSVIEVVQKHLMYSFIPVELPEYKFILKSIISQYELNSKLPSYGITSQQYQSNSDVQNALVKIKGADLIDTELAIKQLDEVIRDVKFQTLFETVYETYNKGEKDSALIFSQRVQRN